MASFSPVDAARACLSPQGRLRETSAALLVAALIAVFNLWTSIQPQNTWTISSHEPNGYYGLETAGFRAGHLYAALAPHPGLLSLKDPYDPVANAPYRAHDMSLYQGHYYLYFGVTPVLLLFWPVAALTGRYVSEPFAVALFCSVAVWAGIGLLLAIRRRHFPRAPFIALLAAWLCLAWATPLNLLVESAQFYQVPISCAIALQALMLVAIYRALHSPARPFAWMALGGLLFGLSMGARPTYLAGFAVLLIPALHSALRSPRGKAGVLAKALAASYLPAGLCGLGLLYYNWARFGSASEFGFRYQLSGTSQMQLAAMSPRYLLPHAALYLFNPSTWGSYFPFVAAPSGQSYGLALNVPWVWFCMAAFLFPAQGNASERAGRVAIILAIAGAFLTNFIFLSCFWFTTARYPGDFANAALILAGVGALALGQCLSAVGRPRLIAAVLSFVAAVSLALSLAVFVGRFPREDAFNGLARIANWPEYAWQRAHGAQFGGLRLQLRLPAKVPAQPEPLLETGRQSDERDWVDIEYLEQNRARLRYFHAGTGFFPGTPFDVPADRMLAVEIHLGSLLPPFGHPAFSGWSREDYDRAKREVRLAVNGTEELRAALTAYDASPATTVLGRLAWNAGGEHLKFTGEITHVDRLPLGRTPATTPPFTAPRPLALTLVLPAGHPLGADPLVVTGIGTHSDLLYCLYDGAGGIRFALDHFGSGGPVSNLVRYDPLVPHSLVVWMGSVAGAMPAASPEASAAGRLVVLFDGLELLNGDQVFYPTSPDTAIVGRNPYGSTDAGGVFTGLVTDARQVALAALPPVSRTGSYGSVDMRLEFPLTAYGNREPLVVTGTSGAGDIVYVRYVDAHHVLFGFDHWGVGGIQGGPIEVDYSRSHRIWVTFASLYPPHSRFNRSDRLEVLLDNKPALQGHFECHPSTADQIKIGANPIGGSTCGAAFTGHIAGIDRSDSDGG